LDNKYRTYRKEIETSMLPENTNEIITTGKQSISQMVNLIIVMEKSGELQVPLNALLTSMIHMTMNRWFRNKNRLHELVIYDFLSRYYTSEIAKNNKKTHKFAKKIRL
jgi:thiopeptide-type bacteriocin biosynthesis protein